MNKIIKVLVIFLSVTISLNGQELIGNWYGKIGIEQTELKVVYHLSDTLGYLQGRMDSPGTGAFNVQLDTVLNNTDSIHFKTERLNTNFSGVVNVTAQKINGIFNLFGNQYPLILSRDSFNIYESGRPQDPKSVDYYVENIAFANYQDSVVLGGTITMPFDPAINKAVVLISGSGPHDRNYNLVQQNHRPFLVLADFLTKNGIAVLRYDERGVGLSSGNYFNATTLDLYRDAQAAVDYLRSRVDLQDAQIGVIGHDEGGIISGMLGDSVDFNILLATPGIRTTDLMLAQTYMASQAQGIPDTILGINFRMYAQVYNYVKQSQSLPSDSLFKNLKILLNRGINKYPSEIKDSIKGLDVFIERQAAIFSTPWYRYYLTIEPTDYLSNISNPLLAIIGTLDQKIPFQSNLAGIETFLKQSGNERFEVFGFEGLNHFFQTAITGAPSEYGLLTETMNEGIMKTIADWIINLQ
jgi:alpha/beta superfamily hydrolase